MARRARANRKDERKEEAAATPVVNDIEAMFLTQEEPKSEAPSVQEPPREQAPSVPEPPKEPAAPPLSERDWMTLSEVESSAGVSRTIISQMVAKGWIPGMEPGKQGRPQEWHARHVACLIRQLRKRRMIVALADAELVAQADCLPAHRLETCVAALTTKGVRIIDADRSLRSLAQITKDPVVIFPA